MIPIYPLKKGEGLPEKLRSRPQLTQKDVSAAVAEILAAVRARGDEALYAYEERFDHADLRKAGLAVTRGALDAACVDGRRQRRSKDGDKRPKAGK